MVDPQLVADALDNHQVTDDQGQVAEDTATEDTTLQEQTTEDESAAAEKSEDQDTLPKEESASENEPDLVPTAEDESGKRYVPESRFKEVYAKWKEAERSKANPTPLPQPERVPIANSVQKTDALEIELLRAQLPQFNPDSTDYSQEIDELGYSIYESAKDKKGNYTMTRLEAGRKALNMAKKITSKVAEARIEARTVKAQQSDQGITNRVLNREGAKADPNKMSLEEKEAWLKETGNW